MFYQHTCKLTKSPARIDPTPIRLVMALSALRLAFHRTCIGAHRRDLFLWNGSAGVLPERQRSRFRVVQTDERSDAAKIEGRAPEIIKRSPNPINHEIPSRESRYSSLTAVDL